ncbi:5'-methylthioadenosine/adenosylhomocysteine nucleosidase [Ruminococcus sp.]|uniref:5'-methylthioadenosine/adenosylhomocysteine nucleosidase n=1 Tax=Ruminococcus sp. TaxID=41978 RepID=UPI003EFEC998
MKTIGIIGAMPSELADLRAALPSVKQETHAGYEFYISEMEGKRIVNVCCGVAKVNAALCAQVLIDRMGAELILNAGIAGGMDSGVHVCDIVIANEVLSHDVNPDFLVKYPPHCAVYPCDQELQEKTAQICERLGIPHHHGRIVSGEAFISSDAVKAEICSRLSPLAVDMESAAIGQCAYRNQVPFLSIRCISDNADDAGAMTFEEFEQVAAKQVADVVLALLAE